jgi:hypothetical protein
MAPLEPGKVTRRAVGFRRQLRVLAQSEALGTFFYLSVICISVKSQRFGGWNLCHLQVQVLDG